MTRLIMFIVGVAFSILPIVSSAQGAEKPTGQAIDVKVLFEKKCSACHSFKKATGQKKAQPEWTETVMRMKNKNGAPVNDEEAKIIIEHLAKNYGK
jgi:hypothetical protein